MKRVTVRCPEQLLGWIAEFGGDEAAALRALATIGAAALGLPGAARPALAEAARRADQRLLALLVELAAGERPDDSHTAAIELSDDSAPAVAWQPGRYEQPVADDDPLAGLGFSV